MEITKFKIAEEQLYHAIDLYREGVHFISALTLAGAAEEIFGKLSNNKIGTNALSKDIERSIKLHEFLWDESATEKEYASIKNRARNEAKHLCEDSILYLDFERESARLIKRAIKNYFLIGGDVSKKTIDFNKRSVVNWRSKNGVRQ